MYRFRASEITVEMPLAQGDPQQRHVAAGFLAALPLPFTNAGCTPQLGQSRADIERDRRIWGAVPSPAVQHQTQPPERRHNANAGALNVSPSSGRICCSLGAERRGARLKGRPSGRQGLHPDGRSTACRFRPTVTSVCGGLRGSRVSDGGATRNIMLLVEPNAAKASHLSSVR
jgi:hypothetical protein